MSAPAGEGARSVRPRGSSSGGSRSSSADQEASKDHTILVLNKRLAHFRAWINQVHARVQQVNPQAVKNSRRLYVGGLAPDTTEEELKSYFHNLMCKTGALAGPGMAVLAVQLKQEKGFAFVEFRSVEETSNAMAFDGAAFRDSFFLKIRRPSNYDPSTAIMLGPMLPDPTMDTSQLEICRTLVEDSPHKLFVGGLPCEWGEDQVKELLLPYGSLKSFNLVMDKATGKSKGYCFCEYAEEATADRVIRSLNLRRLSNKSLTVKRALEGAGRTSAGGGPGSAAGSGGAGSPPLTVGSPPPDAGGGPSAAAAAAASTLLSKLAGMQAGGPGGMHGGMGQDGAGGAAGLHQGNLMAALMNPQHQQAFAQAQAQAQAQANMARMYGQQQQQQQQQQHAGGPGGHHPHSGQHEYDEYTVRHHQQEPAHVQARGGTNLMALPTLPVLW